MVLIFFTYLPLEYGGGTAKFFIETAAGLKHRYPELDVQIVTCDKRVARIILSLYSIYFVSKVDKSFNKETKKSILRKLKNVKYKQAKNFSELATLLEDSDVIYSKNDILEAFIMRVLVRLPKKARLIFGFHTPPHYPFTSSLQSRLHNFLYSSILYKYLLSKASILHVLNIYDYKFVKQLFPHKSVRKVYTPYIFSDSANLKRTSIKGLLHVLWIGRLTEQKGVQDLCDIIEKVNTSKTTYKIKWTIVGDGELRKEIKMLSDRWKNVIYTGYIQNKKIPKILLNHDVFISTSKWEVLPYTLLEAQGFGLPVVCYDIAGNNEIVIHKKTGYLFSTKDLLIKGLCNFDKRKFHNTTIAKDIRNRYNHENSFRKLYDLLR